MPFRVQTSVLTQQERIEHRHRKATNVTFQCCLLSRALNAVSEIDPASKSNGDCGRIENGVAIYGRQRIIAKITHAAKKTKQKTNNNSPSIEAIKEYLEWR